MITAPRLILILKFMVLLSTPSLVATSVGAETTANDKQTIAANAMMKAMGYDQVFDDTINGVLKVMSNDMINAIANASPETQSFHQENPGAIAETVVPFLDELKATMAEYRPEFEQETIKLYSHIFTVEEMNAATAFYTSPLGKNVVQKTPQLFEQSMIISQRLIGARVMEIVQKNVPIIQKSLANKLAAAEKGQQP